MLRAPLLLVFLSVALMAAGDKPSSFGVRRTLAEYKLVAMAELATYFGKNQAVKVADDPDAGAEQAVTKGPAVFLPIVGFQLVPLAKPHEPSAAPASDKEVHEFKKHLAASSAALDFVKQLERKRQATAARRRMQNFKAPVLPLGHNKDYVTAGETGGSPTRVAVVAQDVPKPFYSSQPNHDASATWNQQGASPALQEQQEEQQQQQPTQGSNAGPAPTFSGDHQGHIFPYSGWHSAQPSGYPAKATPSTHSLESDLSKEQQGPKYHRDDVVDAERINTTRFVVHRLNLTTLGQGVSTNITNVKFHDITECLAKVLCTMAERPSVFGPISVNVTDYFSSLNPVVPPPGLAYLKLASAAGKASEGCETLFENCTLSAEMLKIISESNLERK